MCQNPGNLLDNTRILKYLSEIKSLQDHAGPLILYLVAQQLEGNVNIDMSEGAPHGEIFDRWWSNVFDNMRETKEVGGIVKARGEFGKRKWTMEAYWR